MASYIIGAGLAGMAAGIKTGFQILEASDKPGGICRSYNQNGFDFSVGGPHWIFGEGKGLDFIKGKCALNQYERNAGIFYHNTIPFPVQTYASKPVNSISGTIHDSLNQRFGTELMNLFFEPFNEKYTCGYYRLCIQEDDYKSPNAGEKGYVAKFRDPVAGLSYFVDRMAEECDISFDTKVEYINVREKTMTVRRKGEREVIEYDRLISTMPLDNLLRACCVDESKIKLPYTSVIVINIGAKRLHSTPNEHWLYIPFCRTGHHRIGFASNVDPAKAPEGCVSLSVEVAVHPEIFRYIEKNALLNNIIKELKHWRFIGEVLETDITEVKHAYTYLYDVKNRNEPLNWLEENKIYSIGRYGKHKFQGMVQSIEDGLNIQI